MSSGDRVPEEAVGGLAVVRRLRHRQLIDRIDYLRGLRRLARTMTQSDLARALGLTQPSISSALKSAHKVPDPRPGFSGASPYEIAQRYAAGRLTRESMIDELARWGQQPRHDGLRSLGSVRRQPSILAELRKAVRDGLIDQPTHDTILIRHRRLERTRTQQALG